LQNEGFGLEVMNRVMQKYQEIGFAKTFSKSVLGSMNDLAYQYEFLIMRDGGINNIRIFELNQKINRTPLGVLKYKYPIEAVKGFLEGSV
jgi:hypothetical protein